MSLSEQIGRVDGSQNEILKTILKAFGVTISDEKIDKIDLIAKSSENLKENSILSNETKNSYGRDSSITVNDILSLLSVPYNKVMNPQNRYVWRRWTETWEAKPVSTEMTIINSYSSNPAAQNLQLTLSNEVSIAENGKVSLKNPITKDYSWNEINQAKTYKYLDSGNVVYTNLNFLTSTNETFWYYTIKGYQTIGEKVKTYLENVESADPNAYPENGEQDGVFYQKIGYTGGFSSVESGAYTGTANGSVVLSFNSKPRAVFISNVTSTIGRIGILLDSTKYGIAYQAKSGDNLLYKSILSYEFSENSVTITGNFLNQADTVYNYVALVQG